MNAATGLVSGMIISGYLVSGLFFLRFSSQTKDRLFTFFAAAFWLLALQRALLTLLPLTNTGVTILYGVRAAAFILIIWAIVDRNRKGA